MGASRQVQASIDSNLRLDQENWNGFIADMLGGMKESEEFEVDTDAHLLLLALFVVKSSWLFELDPWSGLAKDQSDR